MITVEDGTGLPNADAYISTVDASEYHDQMGNAEWSFRPDLHELAIRNATSILDAKYGTAYRGELLTSTQSLLFPRTVFTDSNGRIIKAGNMPTSLQSATAELALVYIKNDGVLITDKTKEDAVSSESVSVGNGAVTESKTYFREVNEKKTTKSDMLIAPVLKGGGSVTANR